MEKARRLDLKDAIDSVEKWKSSHPMDDENNADSTRGFWRELEYKRLAEGRLQEIEDFIHNKIYVYGRVKYYELDIVDGRFYDWALIEVQRERAPPNLSPTSVARPITSVLHFPLDDDQAGNHSWIVGKFGRTTGQTSGVLSSQTISLNSIKRFPGKEASMPCICPGIPFQAFSNVGDSGAGVAYEAGKMAVGMLSGTIHIREGYYEGQSLSTFQSAEAMIERAREKFGLELKPADN